MEKVEYLRDFDYSNDRLIIGDMEQRDKSYVVLLQKKLNKVINALNEEIKLRKKKETEFANKIEIAEKKAANDIKNNTDLRKTIKEV